MLGHDLKHCASHFAVIKTGGEVDYQYGDFPRVVGDYQNETSNLVGLQHEVTMAKGMMVGNPSTLDEGQSENLGMQPNF